MGESIAKLVIGAEVLFFLVCMIIIIFLIVRRRKIKKTEDFESRNN